MMNRYAPCDCPHTALLKHKRVTPQCVREQDTDRHTVWCSTTGRAMNSENGRAGVDDKPSEERPPASARPEPPHSCGGLRFEAHWSVARLMRTKTKVRILWALPLLSFLSLLSLVPLLYPRSLCLHAERFGCSSVFCNSRKASRRMDLGLGHENQMEHRDTLPQTVKMSIREVMSSAIQIQCH